MLTNLFVDNPLLCLTIIVVSLAAITGLTVWMGWFVDSQTTSRDYLVWDDPKTINYDKSTLAQSMLLSGVTDGEVE